MKINIYQINYDSIVDKYLTEEHFADDLGLMKRFIDKRIIHNISPSRLYKYVKILKSWKYDFFNGESFANLTLEDIELGIASLQRSKYSPNSRVSYKAILKVFYKTMYPDEMGNEPKLTRWISTRERIDHRIPPKSLLTSEDILAIIETVDKLKAKENYKVMLRAAISTHAESGGRIGETLNLFNKDVEIRKEQFNNKTIEYAFMLVNGKTGSRPIFLIKSLKYIKEWMNQHPQKDSLNAYFWLNRRQDNFLAYHGFCRDMKRAARIAGINKPLNTHFFRKSRATSMGKVMSNSIREQALGWIKGSQMSQIYDQLDGTHVKESIFSLLIKGNLSIM
jgi:site-specific recombinase XerD